VILYGDMPVVRGDSLKRLLEAGRDGLAVLTADIDNHPSFGRVVRDASDRVTRIVEVRDASAAERALSEVNVGFYALSGKRLAGWLKRIDNRNAQKEYYLTDLIGLAVADQVAVAGVKVAEAWEAGGVNSKADLAQLERQVQRNVGEHLMEGGVTLADPARIDVRGTLDCGRDVAIDVNCVFEGRVTLGDGVRVGPNCVIRDCAIQGGTQVLAFSHLEDSTIGERCRIGPYARLRPGAQLAEEVHVGNFVEVKASRLGAGSKANHLSYLGDTTIGENVNIGAGTITCNYDGVRKHQTIIEDGAFIGSDTQIIAPVTVHKGAYVGTGTTVREDVPAGALAVSAGKQRNIDGWVEKRKKGVNGK
jgi:bifunctional UDP-N-acetylglucosamine pyrophosphorylase / glucosamine-1-phosphate N-acetyltransferase